MIFHKTKRSVNECHKHSLMGFNYSYMRKLFISEQSIICCFLLDLILQFHFWKSFIVTISRFEIGAAPTLLTSRDDCLSYEIPPQSLSLSHDDIYSQIVTSYFMGKVFFIFRSRDDRTALPGKKNYVKTKEKKKLFDRHPPKPHHLELSHSVSDRDLINDLLSFFCESRFKPVLNRYSERQVWMISFKYVFRRIYFPSVKIQEELSWFIKHKPGVRPKTFPKKKKTLRIYK